MDELILKLERDFLHSLTPAQRKEVVKHITEYTEEVEAQAKRRTLELVYETHKLDVRG